MLNSRLPGVWHDPADGLFSACDLSLLRRFNLNRRVWDFNGLAAKMPFEEAPLALVDLAAPQAVAAPFNSHKCDIGLGLFQRRGHRFALREGNGLIVSAVKDQKRRIVG